MNCPSNPPPPEGYAVWSGAVPDELSQWAVDLLSHVNKYPFGQVWSMPYSGQTVVARKDHHPYTWRNGQIVYGCFQGITLYSPLPAGAVGAQPPQGALSTVDPNAAVFSADAGPNWPLVAVTGGAIVGVSVLFALAIKHAGRAARRRSR